MDYFSPQMAQGPATPGPFTLPVAPSYINIVQGGSLAGSVKRLVLAHIPLLVQYVAERPVSRLCSLFGSKDAHKIVFHGLKYYFIS